MNNYRNNLTIFKEKYHKSCFFNSEFINTDYYFKEDGSFVMHFFCDEKYQGYYEMMHGGVISALIDSAMTKCLFGHGIIAYTVRLNIKYIQAVKINKRMTINITLKKSNIDKIILLKAGVFQNDRKIVTANAKFWVIKKYRNMNKIKNC